MIKVPENVLDNLTLYYGINRSCLSFLGGGREDSDGVVWSYSLDGKDMVFKVLAIKADDVDGIIKLEERLKFVRYLGDNRADIVFPEESLEGRLYHTMIHGKNNFIAYVMKRVPGVHPSGEGLDNKLCNSWGRVVGKLHRLAKRYPSWEHSIVEGKTLLGWNEELESFYGWCKDREVKESWLHTKDKLLQLPYDRECFGFIHNDPHIQNILYDGKAVHIIDFDVANYHWFITDISIAMQHMLFGISGGMERPMNNPEPLRAFIDSFMEGYEKENHLEDHWISKIDLFTNYRRMLLYTVMEDWINTQPGLKASWKKLILEAPEYVYSMVLK